MKKIISLFTTFALLISICATMPISVSAEDSTVEDLSQYLDSAKYTYFDIIDENGDIYKHPLTAKALSYADIEQYDWASEYGEDFFENNFIMFVEWYEPVGVYPPIYSLSSMIRKGDEVQISLMQTGDGELGPTVVRIYCVAIELPKTLCDLEYTAVYNRWTAIYTAQDLKNFADDVNNGNTYEDKYIILQNDIDLSEICGEDINGEEISWEPIGSEENPFNGIFDGNGHTISGLYINSKFEYTGLFGYAGDEAEIKNLTVCGSVNAQSDTDNSCSVGAIAGYNSGTIENCHNKAAVKTENICYVGGIAGEGYNGIIRLCSNSGEISSDMYIVGGICGLNSTTIENCYNTGSISGDMQIGGICGLIIYGDTENCYNIGTIKGNEIVGGIIGDAIVGSFENCYYLENCNADGTVFDMDYCGTVKTAEEFFSGEVAYLLGEAWGQEIGVDEYPVLGGKKVYRIEGENDYEYTNTLSGKFEVLTYAESIGDIVSEPDSIIVDEEEHWNLITGGEGDLDCGDLSLDSSFWETNAVLLLSWGEPQQIRTHTVTSIVETDGSVEIELTHITPDGEYPQIVLNETAVISMPRTALGKTVNITVKEELRKEKTPELSIDYINEKLTGYDGNFGDYIIIPDYDVDIIPINNDWSISDLAFGITLTIVKCGNGATTTNSDEQTLYIPARPDAPEVTAVAESAVGMSDGKITGVSAAMEYKPSYSEDWIDCEGTEITGLAAGMYYVRKKATNSSFASECAEVTIDVPPHVEYNCVKITALYDEDGTLTDITVETIYISEIPEIHNTDTKKIFYWESLENMKPLFKSDIQ